jgi:uncharacterized protein (TIGR01370 family)
MSRQTSFSAMQKWFAWFLAGASLVLMVGARAGTLPAVALYYGNKIPPNEFRAFDVAVVDPDNHAYEPRALQPSTQLYAYVSVGEVRASRSYYADIPSAWKVGRNRAWGSEIIDQSVAQWPAFFADHVLQPLWNRGFRGFFLDTLDSYQLVKGVDARAQQQGLVRLINTLYQRFPGIHLILNRGFEILPQIHDKVEMVAAESLYRGWDAKARRYTEVSAPDRAWLTDRLHEVQQRYHLPVLVIDYVSPEDRKLTRATAERIRRDGFIPWVTDAQLSTMGIGSIEVMPRHVLVLYNGADSPSLNTSVVNLYLQMPLNYMGYIADYVDVRQKLPEPVLGDRYAGVIAWFPGFVPPDRRSDLARWMVAEIGDHMPLAVLGSWGFSTSELPDQTGLVSGSPTPEGALVQTHIDPMLGFEHAPALPDQQRAVAELTPAMARAARPLIAFRDEGGATFVGGAITPWGGFVYNGNVLYEVPGTESFRWIVNPFAFLQQALRLPAIPVPDTTTENGRRLLMAHVDGDGSADIAEFPGRPLALDVLLKQVFEKYRIPQTMSVIEAEVAPWGLYPERSPKMEAIVRKMFRLPWIEVGDHTYSHPFILSPKDAAYVRSTDSTSADLTNLMSKRGYKVDIKREVVGSRDYINSRLAPEDKPVKVLQWPGDADPDVAWLATVYKAGLLNINGGDTYITHTDPTLTDVGPLGLRQGGYLQIYAPITNENIYTNLWRGPFYGFERVIETFEMTNKPRRIKPVDIYYHVYSASKQASLIALHKVYDWAMAQPLYPVHISEFIAKVHDFYDFVVARDGDGWRLRSNGDLRTVRLPAALQHPELAESRGIAGWHPGVDGVYAALTGPMAFLKTGNQQDAGPYLYEANARLGGWQVQNTGREVKFVLQGHVPLEFALANTQSCQVRADQHTLAAVRASARLPAFVQQFRLPNAAARIQIVCPIH